MTFPCLTQQLKKDDRGSAKAMEKLDPWCLFIVPSVLLVLYLEAYITSGMMTVSALPLRSLPLSLTPSLRMDRVFILLMSPTDLWVGFFYSLLVGATVESDARKDAIAPRNVTLKGAGARGAAFPASAF